MIRNQPITHPVIHIHTQNGLIDDKLASFLIRFMQYSQKQVEHRMNPALHPDLQYPTDTPISLEKLTISIYDNSILNKPEEVKELEDFIVEKDIYKKEITTIIAEIERVAQKTQIPFAYRDLLEKGYYITRYTIDNNQIYFLTISSAYSPIFSLRRTKPNPIGREHRKDCVSCMGKRYYSQRKKRHSRRKRLVR